jgi:trimethylamine:corrinoid methyltransferase-like protein
VDLGSKDARERVADKAQVLLADHTVPVLPEAVDRELENLLRAVAGAKGILYA